MRDNYFIEIESRQKSEKGRYVSGDVCLSGKLGQRKAIVLCDGIGSGINANVIASTIASMALTYALSNEDPERASKAIVEAFARGERVDDVRQATFTIISIDNFETVSIIEFENPAVVIVRKSEIIDISKKRRTFITSNGIEVDVYLSMFKAFPEDRVVAFSDGVTLSGYATRRMPTGWGSDGVNLFIKNLLKSAPTISAAELAAKVVQQSEMNDLFSVKNDSSCTSLYFRKARRILICTGPPYNEDNDKELCRRVLDFDGEVIISGGTTAQIVARESGREMSVVMKRDPSRLPPISKMDGVLMVTEGVLTLAKVKSLLESIKNSDFKQVGIDATYVRHLLSHDEIEFLVGSRINAMHQDPNLPVELELRRSVIKDIARILESRFMKSVEIVYI